MPESQRGHARRDSLGTLPASKARALAREAVASSSSSGSSATSASGKQQQRGSFGKDFTSSVSTPTPSRSWQNSRLSTVSVPGQSAEDAPRRPTQSTGEPARRRQREVAGSGSGAAATEGDIGDRLHREAKLRHQRLQQMQSQQAELKRQEEAREATFCPTIHASQRGCRGTAKATHDPEGLATKHKLELRREQRDLDELRDCTFTPQVDQRSEAIMSERAKGTPLSGSLHHALYEDALRRQERKDYYHDYSLPSTGSLSARQLSDQRSQEFLHSETHAELKQQELQQQHPQHQEYPQHSPTLLQHHQHQQSLQQKQLSARVCGKNGSQERSPRCDRDAGTAAAIAAAIAAAPRPTQATSPRRPLSAGAGSRILRASAEGARSPPGPRQQRPRSAGACGKVGVVPCGFR